MDYSVVEGKGKGMSDGSLLPILFSKPPYSLPNLPYELSEDNLDGVDCYFLETDEIFKFLLRNETAPDDTGKLSGQIDVLVNKTTLFPDRLEFHSKEGNAPLNVDIDFKNVKTNQGLSDDLFAFQVPKGAQVKDVTEKIKAAPAAKESTAPDTEYKYSGPQDKKNFVPVEFRLAETEPGSDLTEMKISGSDQKYYLHKEVELSNADVASVNLGRETGNSAAGIVLTFTNEGKEKFAKVTGENIGKRLGIVVAGKLISVPVIKEAITGGETTISGRFTKEEADGIVKSMRGK
jgi:hypothetical protein